MTIPDLYRYVRRKWFPNPQDQQFLRWWRDDGDRTLRQDYPLQPDVIVLDVGGYEGQWASDIFGRYLCRIEVFEPVAEFHRKTAQRFALNSKIRVHPFGLGGRTRRELIHLSRDGSSVYRQSNQTESINIVDVVEWLEQSGVSRIALMKVNIEGGEFELLSRLIESGKIQMIDDLQVQFHRLSPESPQKVNELRSQLARTHTSTYQYDFVWENWRRRQPETASATAGGR